jgi:hypothetical protein
MDLSGAKELLDGKVRYTNTEDEEPEQDTTSLIEYAYQRGKDFVDFHRPTYDGDGPDQDRRNILKAGASVTLTTLVSACLGNDSSQNTPTPTSIRTPTETATPEPTDTPEPTETKEPEENNTEPQDQETLEVRGFQGIYDEAMAEADAPSVPDEMFDEERSNPVNTEDWSARDLERVAVAAAKNASKEHSAQNIAKTLYQTFSSDVDELYADSRRALGRDIVKIFDQVNDEIHYLVPWASQTGEDDMLIEGENADDKTERNLAGLEDKEDMANFSPLDVEQIENRIEYFGGRENISDAEWREAWDNFMNHFGDIIVGENYGTDELAVTRDAAIRIDGAEIEGYEGIDHIKEINTQYSAIKQDTQLGDGKRMRVHYDGGWKFDVTSDYDGNGYAEAPTS